MDRLQAAFNLYGKAVTHEFSIKLKKHILYIDGKVETKAQAKEIDAHAAVLQVETAKSSKKAEISAHYKTLENLPVSLNGQTYSHDETDRNRINAIIQRGKETEELERVKDDDYRYSFPWFSVTGDDPALSILQLIELSSLFQTKLFAATKAAKGHKRSIDGMIDLNKIQNYAFK